MDGCDPDGKQVVSTREVVGDKLILVSNILCIDSLLTKVIQALKDYIPYYM